MILKVKVMCGTVEFVAPEIVEYNHVSTATGFIILLSLG